jgi:hypothetical protein
MMAKIQYRKISYLEGRLARFREFAQSKFSSRCKSGIDSGEWGKIVLAKFK